MNKIIILFFILIFSSSCQKDFLERSSLTAIAEGNFWTSESDAFLALNGVYASLQSKSMYGGNLNGWQGFPGFDNIGDNAFNQYKWEGPGVFMEGNLNPNSGPTRSIWNELYRGIARVNLVIQNVDEISEDLVDEETKKELLGQAYFLRGMLYFNLAIYYEDVPLILKPQTLEDAFVAKNSYDEVTAQIIEDLILAVDYLPVDQGASLFGYAERGAALGMLARVQLYNNNLSGENGVLALTEEILGLGYSLHPNYGELFTPDGESSNEILFSVRFLRGADSNSGENFSATFGGTPKVDQRPMPNLVNDYYCTDGLSISESPLFNSEDERENRDPRALATIYFKGDVWIDEPAEQIFPGNGPTKYGMRKFIRRGPDAEGNGIALEGSQDFYIIRYADVLLMRAEALAETNDIGGAASLVNEVRARVGMPSVEEVEGSVNQSQMIEIVRHERRVELALEGLRFMDLKRWGTVEEAFQRAISDPVGPYNPQYLGKKSEVFPIPQDEIDVNPNLVQNPVW